MNSNFVQIYVSTSGHDSNPGTFDKPFQSLNGAIEYLTTEKERGAIQGDVEIVLKGGTYYLNKPIIITNKNWEGQNTLYIKGEKNRTPTIKGGKTLGHFEKVSDHLWKMDVSGILNKENITISQLFVNGKKAIRARTPNVGELFKTQGATQTFSSGTSANQIIKLSDLQTNKLSSISLKNSSVIASFNHLWLNTKGYLNNISHRDKTFSFISPVINKVFAINTTAQFFLENSRSFLDAPGEWVIEKDDILYYIPRKDEDINTSVAETPILSELLIIEGSQNKTVNNIVIENISFQYTKLTLPPQGQLYHQAAFDTGSAIMISYSTNIEFRNCEITNISNNAIWFHKGCINNKLIQNYIHDLGIGGVKIGIPEKSIASLDKTSNIVIDNNIIRTGGQEVSNGVGVLIFNSGNNTISHNDISDFKYSGISAGWTWGYSLNQAHSNKINNNHIHHIGWAELSDLGGIYILGPSQNTVIEDNVINNIFSYDYKGWGIYLDEGSSDILIENNLVYNCKSSGFHQHYGKNNIVRNNIFANQILSQLEVSKVEPHVSFEFTNNIVYFNKGVLSHNSGWRNANFITNNNLFWDSRRNIRFYNMDFDEWKKTTQKDMNSIIADPLFRDPDNYDFRFRSRQNIEKINFTPFDYSQAGVYGSVEWKKKAVLDPEIIKAFNESVERRMKEEGISK